MEIDYRGSQVLRRQIADNLRYIEALSNGAVGSWSLSRVSDAILVERKAIKEKIDRAFTVDVPLARKHLPNIDWSKISDGAIYDIFDRVRHEDAWKEALKETERKELFKKQSNLLIREE